MNVLSLFDGISCGRVALERAGFPVNEYIAYEIDKYAMQISNKNYPDIKQGGNVFDANYSQYKDFDILLGGSPCTYWSIARNNRETTCDGEGGKLFMQYVRALNESNPKYFIYENNYSISKDIKDAISAELGVKPIMINSALVSAQQRKREYWTNIPVNGLPADKGILLKDILELGVCCDEKAYQLAANSCTTRRSTSKVGCLRATYYKTGVRNLEENLIQGLGYEGIVEPLLIGEIESNATYRNGSEASQQYRVYSPEAKARAMCANGGGVGAKTGLYACPVKLGEINGGGQGNRVYSINGKAVAQTAQGGGMGSNTGLYAMPFNVALREANMELVPYVVDKISEIVAKYGYLPEMFNPYNKAEIKDKHPTFTASSGSRQTASGTVLIIQKIQDELKTEINKNVYLIKDGLILIKGNFHPINLPDGLYIIRKLTPVECERLQTLPDNYTAGISDSQRYKSIGNGWTVDVITFLLSFINGGGGNGK